MVKHKIRQFGKRRAAFRNERKRFLVVTDGIVTEKTYFTYLNDIAHDQIIVKAKNVDVDKLLDMALDIRSKSSYDGVAVVCDIDERLKSDKSRKLLEETIMRAEENGVEMCLSHESFDIWVLMHSGKKIPAKVSERASESGGTIDKVFYGGGGK